MISYLKKTALICFSYLPSPIKLGFYRLMGAQIGSGVSLGFGSYILPYYSGFDKIRIGENTMIGDNVRIRAKELNLGRDVVIKEGTEISV